MLIRKPSVAATDLLPTLILLAFMFVPLLGAIWVGARQANSAVEKRVLAGMPAWPASFKQWMAFPKAFDAFARDRFGFRGQLLHGYKWIVAGVFHDSASSGAFVGRQGWLYVTGSGSLADMQGISDYTPAQLVNDVQQINARGELLAVRRIRYGFVVFPDKHTIYPQFLPRGLYGGFDRRRLNALDSAMAGTGHDYFFDATDALRRAAPSSPFRLYFKSDTHWNWWGRYLGYRAWVDAGGGRLGLRRIDYRFDEFRHSSRQIEGDLSLMSGYSPHDPEIKPPLDAGCWNIRPWQVSAQMLAWANTVTERMQVAHCQGRGNALVFHDSFLPEKLVVAGYARAWLAKGYPDDVGFGHLVDALRPDVVLVQRVERGMDDFPRTDLAALVRELGVIGEAAKIDAAGRLVIGTQPGAFARPVREVAVALDQVLRVGDNVQLSGWARSGDRSPAAVLAVADGRVVAEAPLTLPRPDVAKASGNARLAWSGFQLDIPVAAVRGVQDVPHLYFVGFDDYGTYQATAAFKQRLQVAAARIRQ